MVLARECSSNKIMAPWSSFCGAEAYVNAGILSYKILMRSCMNSAFAWL